MLELFCALWILAPFALLAYLEIEQWLQRAS